MRALLRRQILPSRPSSLPCAPSIADSLPMPSPRMMRREYSSSVGAASIWRRRTAMEHYAGIDVSLELSSVCVVDAQGKIVKEAKVASEPKLLLLSLRRLALQ